MYHKKISDLSQSQVIENIKDIVNSEYFKKYDFSYGSSSISSDIINISSLGGFRERTLLPIKVSELSDTVGKIFDTIDNNGTLNIAHLILYLPEERLKEMAFEKRLYDQDLELPISFAITREKINSYIFKVYNFGFKEEFFESEGLDLKDANARKEKWHQEVDRNLNKILTYKVK